MKKIVLFLVFLSAIILYMKHQNPHYDPGLRETTPFQSAISDVNPDAGYVLFRGKPMGNFFDQPLEKAISLIIYGHEDHVFRFQLSEVEQKEIIGLMNRLPSKSASANIQYVLSTLIGRISTHPLDHQIDEMVRFTPYVFALALQHAQEKELSLKSISTGYIDAFVENYHPNTLPKDVRRDIVKALTLIYLENGMGVSTFTVRVGASSRNQLSDLPGLGFGALNGKRHGAALTDSIRFQQEIQDVSNIRDFVDQKKKEGVFIPGFGHRMYKKKEDVRIQYMRELFKKHEEVLRDQTDVRLFELGEKLKIAIEQSDHYGDLKPNIDNYVGYFTLKVAGFPVEMAMLQIGLGRIIGWIAHHKEEIESKGPLVRPDHIYSGSKL